MGEREKKVERGCKKVFSIRLLRENLSTSSWVCSTVLTAAGVRMQSSFSLCVTMWCQSQKVTEIFYDQICSQFSFSNTTCGFCKMVMTIQFDESGSGILCIHGTCIDLIHVQRILTLPDLIPVPFIRFLKIFFIC